MTHYIVTWNIDIYADSPEQAAKEALVIQRDPESTATFFIVGEKGSDDTLFIEVGGEV